MITVTNIEMTNLVYYDKVGELRRFPNVRTGRTDHGRTRHFGNEICFFYEILLKNHNITFRHNIWA